MEFSTLVNLISKHIKFDTRNLTNHGNFHFCCGSAQLIFLTYSDVQIAITLYEDGSAKIAFYQINGIKLVLINQVIIFTDPAQFKFERTLGNYSTLCIGEFPNSFRYCGYLSTVPTIKLSTFFKARRLNCRPFEKYINVDDLFLVNWKKLYQDLHPFT